MPTFIEAPHVRAPAHRLAALRARPDVAVSIDTESTPPQVLLVRGRAQIAEVDGIDPDYAVSARQYLGDEAASQYLAMADQPGTRMARITVRPTWVGVLDFAGGRLPGVMAPPVPRGTNDPDHRRSRFHLFRGPTSPSRRAATPTGPRTTTSTPPGCGRTPASDPSMTSSTAVPDDVDWLRGHQR